MLAPLAVLLLASCGVLGSSTTSKTGTTVTPPTVFRTIPTIPGFGVTTTSPAVASAAATPAAPGNAADSGSTYTIKAGDSLAGIAAKNGVVFADLLALNGLQATSLIHPGQVLKLPAKPPPTTVVTYPLGTVGTYTVVAGDALSGIASKLKVAYADLLTVNKMPAGGSPIHPGQKLAVPCRCKGAKAFP